MWHVQLAPRFIVGDWGKMRASCALHVHAATDGVSAQPRLWRDATLRLFSGTSKPFSGDLGGDFLVAGDERWSRLAVHTGGRRQTV